MNADGHRFMDEGKNKQKEIEKCFFKYLFPAACLLGLSIFSKGLIFYITMSIAIIFLWIGHRKFQKIQKTNTTTNVNLDKKVINRNFILLVVSGFVAAVFGYFLVPFPPSIPFIREISAFTAFAVVLGTAIYARNHALKKLNQAQTEISH